MIYDTNVHEIHGVTKRVSKIQTNRKFFRDSWVLPAHSMKEALLGESNPKFTPAFFISQSATLTIALKHAWKEAITPQVLTWQSAIAQANRSSKLPWSELFLKILRMIVTFYAPHQRWPISWLPRCYESQTISTTAIIDVRYSLIFSLLKQSACAKGSTR